MKSPPISLEISLKLHEKQGDLIYKKIISFLKKIKIKIKI